MCIFAGGNNNIDNMMSADIYLRGKIASDKT